MRSSSLRSLLLTFGGNMAIANRVVVSSSGLDDADYGDRGVIIDYLDVDDTDNIVWLVQLDKDGSTFAVSDRFVTEETLFDY